MGKQRNFEHSQDDLVSTMHGSVLVLTIDRQESYNAWTSALRDELARKLMAADREDAVSAVVLTGAGQRAFCSGQDLSELQEFNDGKRIEAWLGRLKICYDAVRGFSKPLVAAINGVAAGSGFQITQFCDYVVAHPGVRVGQTEVSSGLPSVFGTWLMWERVGRRSVELALQGRLMQVDEAKDLGFIQEIASASDVLTVAIGVAERLAKQPRVAYRLSKAANRQFDESRYSGAMSMALSAYRDAFDSGAPQREIVKFFEQRQARRAGAAA